MKDVDDDVTADGRPYLIFAIKRNRVHSATGAANRSHHDVIGAISSVLFIECIMTQSSASLLTMPPTLDKTSPQPRKTNDLCNADDQVQPVEISVHFQVR